MQWTKSLSIRMITPIRFLVRSLLADSPGGWYEIESHDSKFILPIYRCSKFLFSVHWNSWSNNYHFDSQKLWANSDAMKLRPISYGARPYNWCYTWLIMEPFRTPFIGLVGVALALLWFSLIPIGYQQLSGGRCASLALLICFAPCFLFARSGLII
jgi:hypothetical protein